MKNITLAVLGCGNMAQAIIRALTEQKTVTALQQHNITLHITVSDIDGEKLQQFDVDIDKTTDNAVAVQNADYVLLAVKPQVSAQVLHGLHIADKIVLSIMAGVSIDTLKTLTGSTRIVRIMPNLNARIFRSYNAFACCGIAPQEKEFVKVLLSAFGIASEVEENSLDAVTGLTGSAPAFVFMFIKSFIEEGITLGFTPTQARQMALATVIGSAELIQSDPQADIGQLIDSVCSKGGTTIEGVHYLTEQNFEQITKTAVDKAVARAKELRETK